MQSDRRHGLGPLALVKRLDRAIRRRSYFASRVAGQPRALARQLSTPSLVRPRAIPRQRSRSRNLLGYLRPRVRLGRLCGVPRVVRVLRSLPRGLVGALEGRRRLASCDSAVRAAPRALVSNACASLQTGVCLARVRAQRAPQGFVGARAASS